MVNPHLINYNGPRPLSMPVRICQFEEQRLVAALAGDVGRAGLNGAGLVMWWPLGWFEDLGTAMQCEVGLLLSLNGWNFEQYPNPLIMAGEILPDAESKPQRRRYPDSNMHL